MRAALSALVAVHLALACQEAPPPPRAREPAAAPPLATNLTGKVLETIDAAQYTYLRLQTAQGEAWAAVPASKQRVGTTLTVVNPIWMESFTSNSLHRTWPRIAFGTLEGDAGEHSAGTALPPGHPATAPAAEPDRIKVARASGAQGRTVADVWAQRSQLENKRVSIRGKVVKATNGVLGKNWIHLRDGTGAGESSDLTVASEQTASVGDTVLVSGTVKLDRDLGAGYHYAVIVEDAQIQPQ